MPRNARPGSTTARRPASPEASSRLVEAAAKAWSIAVRAGETHRFTRVWAVVVDGRIYVRSWGLSPGGWYRSLLAARAGTVQVGRHASPFRAVRVRGEALKRTVDRGYAKKYARPGETKYTLGLCGPASRGSTLELRLTE